LQRWPRSPSSTTAAADGHANNAAAAVSTSKDAQLSHVQRQRVTVSLRPAHNYALLNEMYPFMMVQQEADAAAQILAATEQVGLAAPQQTTDAAAAASAAAHRAAPAPEFGGAYDDPAAGVDAAVIDALMN
jgi:hypothetical protein